MIAGARAGAPSAWVHDLEVELRSWPLVQLPLGGMTRDSWCIVRMSDHFDTRCHAGPRAATKARAVHADSIYMSSIISQLLFSAKKNKMSVLLARDPICFPRALRRH